MLLSVWQPQSDRSLTSLEKASLSRLSLNAWPKPKAEYPPASFFVDHNSRQIEKFIFVTNKDDAECKILLSRGT